MKLFRCSLPLLALAWTWCPLAAAESPGEGFDLVFAGQIAAIVDPIPMGVDVPDSEMVLDYGFVIEKLWKGEVADTVWVRTLRADEDCPLRFVLEWTYLVYARIEGDRFRTDGCSGSRRIMTARDDLFRLGLPVYDSGGDRVPVITLESLLADMKSPDRGTRIGARATLQRLEEVRAEAIPAFVEGLRSAEASDRAECAAALGRMGATETWPALVEAMGDEDADVREQTASALGKIGVGDTAVVAALAAALADPEADVRQSAARALGRLGADAVPAVPELEDAAGDPEERVRAEAARALEAIRAARAER